MLDSQGQTLNFDHGRHTISGQEARNGQPACLWRQMGCKLADAMKGSDMDVYYSLLCEVVRIANADMEIIRPSKRDEEGDVIPKPEPPDQPPLVEKVADMTHRGAGL